MIIGNQAIAPTMSNVGQTAKATMKASARLFGFFEKMVYTNQKVAIWRELVANGQDAQKDAGNSDASVIVTLPTTFTPYAKVRDFGTGMSHLFLMGDPDKGIPSKFMEYAGESTKQLSDDMIGGFSIGSKAPLSYTEQFALASYIDGVVRNYSVYKDADGEPAIAFLSENTTDEPNGVEVSFPVEQTDISKFKEAALTSLKYFKPLPVLKNSAEQLEGPAYTVEGDTWAFRAGQTVSQVVMGGIAYPIDTASVPRNLHDILGFGIDFQVPIGGVGIALSREGLMYDDAAIRVITSLCEGVRPKIQDHINKMFAGFATKWEAQTAYNKMINENGYTASARMIESLAQYNGEKLQRYIDPQSADKVLMASYSTTRYNKRGRNTWSASVTAPPFQAWGGPICPTDVQHIVLVDTAVKPQLRIRAYIEQHVKNNEGALFFRKRPTIAVGLPDGTNTQVDNDLEWDVFVKSLGSPKVIMLSTIEPAVVTRGPSTARVEKIRGYKADRINAEFVDALPAGGGFYVEMEAFVMKNITQMEASALDTGGKPLLYFNKGDIDKVKKNPEWKCAKAEFEAQKASYLKTHKNAKIADAFVKINSNNGWSNRDYLGARLIEILAMSSFTCPKRGCLAQFNALHKIAQPDLTQRDKTMRGFCQVDGKKELTMLKNLLEEIKTKYPELCLLLKNDYSSASLVPVYNKLV